MTTSTALKSVNSTQRRSVATGIPVSVSDSARNKLLSCSSFLNKTRTGISKRKSRSAVNSVWTWRRSRSGTTTKRSAVPCLLTAKRGRNAIVENFAPSLYRCKQALIIPLYSGTLPFLIRSIILATNLLSISNRLKGDSTGFWGWGRVQKLFWGLLI